MSVRRFVVEPSPSMVDVQGEDMDRGWPVYSATSSPAGLKGRSFAGDEDEYVDDDEGGGDCSTTNAQNSDNVQNDMDNVGQTDGGKNVVGPQSSRCGNKLGGKDGAARNKKQNIPWSLEERITLSRLMAEDDALMADAEGQHRFKKRKGRYEWVHDRMADHRFPHRSAEDCRKKWQGMMAVAKLILDKCEDASGKPSLCDMTMEQRKADQVPVDFEKALWEAMEWQLNRPSIKCDNTLALENLSGNAGGPSAETGPPQHSSGKNGSGGKATEDSDN
ncbi:hypothetical protein CBR_g38145 [Chara braunii]|uniref:Myb-like domain-containing protein n=1 Tax=Chara braunii TaxID=69332 RepID=A0A388LPG8_CHABU|nr:hypothetical protein CBR_g38145 [Chara braunii]|eukprot:GBG84171.1 hypothetical protein CBR_g38145 [Chara braunii]